MGAVVGLTNLSDIHFGWVGVIALIQHQSVAFDVAAKCFQVSAQLHSSPVVGWLRSRRCSISWRSHSLEDLVKDVVSD